MTTQDTIFLMSLLAILLVFLGGFQVGLMYADWRAAGEGEE